MTYQEAMDLIDEHTDYGGSVDKPALAVAIADQAAGEPDWSHPKLQALLSRCARLSLQLRIIEDLIDDPEHEYDTDSDYASIVTDRVYAFVKAANAAAIAPTTGSGPGERRPFAFCKVEDVMDNDSMLAQIGAKRGDKLYLLEDIKQGTWADAARETIKTSAALLEELGLFTKANELRALLLSAAPASPAASVPGEIYQIQGHISKTWMDVTKEAYESTPFGRRIVHGAHDGDKWRDAYEAEHKRVERLEGILILELGLAKAQAVLATRDTPSVMQRSVDAWDKYWSGGRAESDAVEFVKAISAQRALLAASMGGEKS